VIDEGLFRKELSAGKYSNKRPLDCKVPKKINVIKIIMTEFFK
jgi:hypothetical protein